VDHVAWSLSGGTHTTWLGSQSARDDSQGEEEEELLGPQLTSLDHQHGEVPKHSASPPWWSWPMLALSVCAVSSAGAAFKSFRHVPPVLLACWRLQVEPPLKP
jgi:hypothetical protein